MFCFLYLLFGNSNFMVKILFAFSFICFAIINSDRTRRTNQLLDYSFIDWTYSNLFEHSNNIFCKQCCSFSRIVFHGLKIDSFFSKLVFEN